MYFTVFGRENCPYCVRAKEFLKSRGLEFSYKDVMEDEVFFMQMSEWVKEATGAPPKTVPQIFLDDTYVGGYDDLVTRLEREEEILPSDYLGEL